MAANKTTSPGDRVTQDAAMPAASPMIAPQLEQFWKAQDSILREAERYARAWFERRHAATRSALDVARDATGNGGTGPVSALQAISDWQRRSAERMAEDIQDWAEFCARCSGHVVTAGTGAARDSLQAAEERATAADGSRHATAA
jgi:hypothetical protein